jgi:hypothetical protein
MRWFGTAGNQAATPPFDNTRRDVLDAFSKENHTEEKVDAGLDMALKISSTPCALDAEANMIGDNPEENADNDGKNGKVFGVHAEGNVSAHTAPVK